MDNNIRNRLVYDKILNFKIKLDHDLHLHGSVRYFMSSKFYMKDLNLYFHSLASNFRSSISVANMRHNHIIFMYPFVHVYDAILYKSDYSQLQNRVESIRRDHSFLWLVMFFLDGTTTQRESWSVLLTS